MSVVEKNFTRADIETLAELLYEQAGGIAELLKRIRNYKSVPVLGMAVHNYYYVHKNVYDYSDLNATLGQAVLFLAGDSEKVSVAGENFVKILTCLAETGYLTDYTFCDKAFEGYSMALLVHAWMLVKENKRFAEICRDSQAAVIEDWFYTRAIYMFRDKDKALWETFRPYDNQEIGIGICVLLARLFEQRDPKLSKNFFAMIDERLNGWEKKNGNTDDTLFYTPIFTKSLMLHALYRPRPELLKLKNCRQTFEGILRQQPGNGICTTYNWTQHTSMPEMMAVGAYLFRDGRYKWMANRFLQERMEKRNRRIQFSSRNITEEAMDAAFTEERNAELQEVVVEELSRKDRYDHVWEGLTDNIFHLWLYWDDGLEPIRPAEPGGVLEKSAGQGRYPYDSAPILPDKIVLREGWGQDDMFVLLNLWGGQNSPSAKTVSHRYPGSNEIISLVCGEQFLVQNINQVTRDGLIRREELNAFNIKREGEWQSALKETYNSKIQFCEALETVEASKTTLYDYLSWTNERTALLIKGGYFVVFDQSYGAQAEEGGVRWHLQGDIIDRNEQSLKLRLLDSELSVLYPHDPCKNHVELTQNHRIIPIYQHHADYDLDLMAQSDRMGFVTLFCPSRGKTYSAAIQNVVCASQPAHPNALAVRVSGDSDDLIGTRLSMYRDEYDYGGIKTDAEAFVMQNYDREKLLTVFHANTIKLDLQDQVPAEINVQGLTDAETKIAGTALSIRFSEAQSGTIQILPMELT